MGAEGRDGGSLEPRVDGEPVLYGELARIGSSYRAQLEEIYREHKPRKLSDIDQLLLQWAGREPTLISVLKAKYLGAPTDSVDELFELVDTDWSDTVSYVEIDSWWRSRRLAGQGQFSSVIRPLVARIAGGRNHGELDRAGLRLLLQELMLMDDPYQWSRAVMPQEADICGWLRLDARYAHAQHKHPASSPFARLTPDARLTTGGCFG
jgi:hypothetical protein